ASFIFTRCGGACPQVSATMQRLQQQTAGRKDVLLVSFSVDPEHDTPEVLRRYGDSFHADPDPWPFLTGDREAIYGLIQSSFHLAVYQNEGPERQPGNEVTHSSRLALVDPKGHLRGYFEGRGRDPEGNSIDDLPRLKQEINALTGRASGLP